MRLPRLPRPSLPWTLLALASLGAGGYALHGLLVVEVTQWGFLVDAEAGTVPPASGLRIEAPRREAARCDSLAMDRLFPHSGDSSARKRMRSSLSPYAPVSRLEPAVLKRLGLDTSQPWCSVLLPSLTFRSRLSLPLEWEQEFPDGSTSFSRPGSQTSWRLGPVTGDRLPGRLSPEELGELDAADRLLVQGTDTVGALRFEGAVASPARVGIERPAGDTVCFVNRGPHALHDFEAWTDAFPPGRGGRTPRLDPGQRFCLTEPGGRTPPRVRALRHGLGELQARAFAAAWERQELEDAAHFSAAQWSAWLDPASADSALPLRLRWPLDRVRRHLKPDWPFARFRRHLMVVHREPILDSNGCPDHLFPLRGEGTSEATESKRIAWPTNAEILRQAAMERHPGGPEGNRDPSSVPAPRIGRNAPRLALALGTLRWDRPSERSENSVLQVLRAHLPGLGQLVRTIPLEPGSTAPRRFELHLTIAPEGTVIACEVLGSLPDPLREDIRDKVRHYRFQPLPIRSNANARVEVRILGHGNPPPIDRRGGS